MESQELEQLKAKSFVDLQKDNDFADEPTGNMEEVAPTIID